METREDILDFLKTNREFLRKQFCIEKIGLFGSFARNEQTSKSDIDLIIELNISNTDVYLLKKRIREFFVSHFNRSVDLAREKYLRSYAREAILKEVIFV
jgi:predicted nucleotidyltransferase